MKTALPLVISLLLAQYPAAAQTKMEGAVANPTANRWVSGATDILLSTDCFNYVNYTSDAPVKVSVPANLPGLVCDIGLVQRGKGAVTPTPTAKVVANPSIYKFTKTAGVNAMIVIHYYSHGGVISYDIWGQGAP